MLHVVIYNIRGAECIVGRAFASIMPATPEMLHARRGLFRLPGRKAMTFRLISLTHATAENVLRERAVVCRDIAEAKRQVEILIQIISPADVYGYLILENVNDRGGLFASLRLPGRYRDTRWRLKGEWYQPTLPRWDYQSVFKRESA